MSEKSVPAVQVDGMGCVIFMLLGVVLLLTTIVLFMVIPPKRSLPTAPAITSQVEPEVK